MRIFFITVLFSLTLTVNCFAGIDMGAIATIESSNNPNAYNKRSGAIGMYQVTDICRRDYNQFHKEQIKKMDLYNERVNRQVSEWYFDVRLPQLLKHYGKGVNLENLLWAYNAGAKKVRDGIMPEETRNYIIKYHKVAR